MVFTTKITVVWDVMPCTLVGRAHFETLGPSRRCHIPEGSSLENTVNVVSVPSECLWRISAYQLQLVTSVHVNLL
jgi:hypothetical protein